MHKNLVAFFLVPGYFKKQELCKIAIVVDLWLLNDIADYLKTQKNCDDVVRSDPYSLQFVSDMFVMLQELKIWHDDNDYYYEDEFIEWYDRFEKRKA